MGSGLAARLPVAEGAKRAGPGHEKVRASCEADCVRGVEGGRGRADQAQHHAHVRGHGGLPRRLQQRRPEVLRHPRREADAHAAAAGGERHRLRLQGQHGPQAGLPPGHHQDGPGEDQPRSLVRHRPCAGRLRRERALLLHQRPAAAAALPRERPRHRDGAGAPDRRSQRVRHVPRQPEPQYHRSWKLQRVLQPLQPGPHHALHRRRHTAVLVVHHVERKEQAEHRRGERQRRRQREVLRAQADVRGPGREGHQGRAGQADRHGHPRREHDGPGQQVPRQDADNAQRLRGHRRQRRPHHRDEPQRAGGPLQAKHVRCRALWRRQGEVPARHDGQGTGELHLAPLLRKEPE
mmetsp:Transcript_111804/g.316244  ORF Transcript_111804/g.316244 Transcript_111804/m.316244 type:complete len:350 (+) Transcript_111804:472-1521(+)